MNKPKNHSKKLEVLLVEDESEPLELLITYINNNFGEFLNIVGTCVSGQEALNLLATKKIDWLFLDMGLKDMTGMDVLNQLQQVDFFLTFVTSAPEFIRVAFERSHLPYLIKPYSETQFINCIQKILDNQFLKFSTAQLVALANNINEPHKKLTLVLKIQKEHIIIPVNEIVYCSTSETTVSIFLQNEQQIVCNKRINELDELLPNYQFTRIHSNHIVNLSFIQKHIPKKQIILLKNDKLLPVSKLYQQIQPNLSFLDKIKSLFGK